MNSETIMNNEDNSRNVNKEDDMNTSPNTSDRVADAAALTGVGAVATGTTAAAIGVTTTVTTAGVSSAAIAGTGAAVGGLIGGVGGGIAGASVGIATGGTAIAGTIPLAVAGGGRQERLSVAQ